jgi:beta-glucosidase
VKNRLLTLLFLLFWIECFYAQPDSTDLKLFESFGTDFTWGAACAAYQVEGAWDLDGKGLSVWDDFTHHRGKIKTKENGDQGTDFYHRYNEDILLAKQLGMDAFRFSISWSRIFPEGAGKINPEGVAFYHRVLDACKTAGIEPWVTLYHWDLPLTLEKEGGWANREIIQAFEAFVRFCAEEYGTKVKHWMVMNEPAAFVGLGYLAGIHAPGKISIRKFLKATHHVCLSLAEGGRTLKELLPQAMVGTTFSCSTIQSIRGSSRNNKAVKRMDALLNRLYIEPSLGMGYPSDDLPALKRLKRYMLPGDSAKLAFSFDFIGLQNYFRVLVRANRLIPVVGATRIRPEKLGLPVNEMGFEVYPEGMLSILRQFSKYPIDNFYITENGVCVNDQLTDNAVHDKERIQFFRDYLSHVSQAKKEGIPINGYFVWSLTDNFEWNEGFRPRFGLVHVDYSTMKRTIKDSGWWFKALLTD